MPNSGAGQRIRKRVLTVFALLWAILGMLWAQVIALPDPLLPPPSFARLVEIPASTSPARFMVMLAKEYSLLLCTFAFIGIIMAALARRAGSRKSALATTVLSAATVVISLFPVAQAWRTASAEAVPLSLEEYFAGLSYTADRSPETVTYAHPGAKALKLDIWRPPREDRVQAKRGPAVVVVHGGGWVSGNRSQFPRWDAWLADQGYVVFDIDYRLSPPPRWREAPGDVECAVGWVKKNARRYRVDPRRVVLMGRSAGGQLALLAAYDEGYPGLRPSCNVRGNRVAAVVAFYPATDLTRFYLMGMKSYLGGTPGSVPRRYRFSSPINHVTPADPPTFLAYGSDDQIVPPEQSRLLARGLRKAGVPHSIVELPSANHTFDFAWGGWNSQITRFLLKRFLHHYLNVKAGTKDNLVGGPTAARR